MKKKMWKVIPVLFTSAVLTSCATTMGNSANETLNVRSAPDQATYAQSPSSYVDVKLPRGIELQIPEGWWVIGADLNRAIETMIDRSADLRGLEPMRARTTNLITANSMPRSTYASVRVDSIIPPSISPSEATSMRGADMREHENLLGQFLQADGYELLDFPSSRIEKISDHPVLITEYRRSGPKGPVLVQINQIFTPGQEISFCLSYRESERALWKSAVDKIRKSILIKTNWKN